MGNQLFSLQLCQDLLKPELPLLRAQLHLLKPFWGVGEVGKDQPAKSDLSWRDCVTTVICTCICAHM